MPEAEPEGENANAELAQHRQPLLDGRTLRALESGEARYRTIVAAGGWPTVPAGPSFRPGDGDPRTASLARRLAVSMDLPAPITGGMDAGAIARALQQFQSRHGLRPTGVADRQTLEALNVPAEARLAQLRANITRIRDLSQAVAQSPRYILVNIPAFQLEAVEGGQVARRHRVIVGRIERPTPGVKAQIRNVNFYPAWHVPESVARLDLIPHLQKDPDYLGREHIRVLTDWKGNEVAGNGLDWRSPAAAQFKFRQDPGPWNALGLIRLDMPNPHAVYMHDTPMKDLFGQRQRAISAGCVRVEDVARLTAWVLSGVPGWNQSRIDEVLANGQPVDVALSTPVPVLFSYMTAWAADDGRVDFRPDLYGQDGISQLVASYAVAPRAGTGGRLIMSP